MEEVANAVVAKEKMNMDRLNWRERIQSRFMPYQAPTLVCE